MSVFSCTAKFIRTYKPWKVFLLLFLSQIPLLIAYYPGLTTGDTGSSIAQFFWYPTYASSLSATPENIWTNHHMVLFTILIGGCIKLGALFDNMNIGYFAYTLGQVLITTAIFTYSIDVFRRKATKFATVTALLYLMLSPLVSVWQITSGKDSFFAMFFTLLLVLLYQIVDSNGLILKSIKFDVILLITNFSIVFSRGQGSYLSLLTFVVFAVVYRKRFIRILLIGIVPAIFYLTIFTQILLPMYHISATGKQETFGFMFQQTARCARESVDFTEEEISAINAILPFDKLSQLYNPTSQDRVKFEYNQQASDEELSTYIQTWAKMLIKYPGVYIRATWYNIKDFFLPLDRESQGERLLVSFPVHLRVPGDISKLPQFEYLFNTERQPYHGWLESFYRFVYTTPVLEDLMYQPYIYFWASVVLLCIAFLRLGIKCTLFFVPILIQVAFLFIYPVVSIRYVLYLAYCLPVMWMIASVKNPILKFNDVL